MLHKRRRSETDRADFELPPSSIAKPLPTTRKPNASTANPSTKPHKKRKPKGPVDDTPKAFIRLQNLLKTGKQPSGLDDGNSNASKKRKRSEPAPAAGAAVPTIQPNERLAEFSARVDSALPLSTSLITKTPKGADPVPGIKVRRTKKEKKMQKMYEQWRIEDTKIKAKREEKAEDDDEDVVEDMALGPKTGKKKRRSKRARRNGETGLSDDDPWKELIAKRGETGKRSLHDVVQAPPQLPVVKQKMRVASTGAGVLDGVPKAAGSLRRREELAALRSGVVEGYRRLMEGRRGAADADE